MIKKKEKVLVAMSGGVDSSVAAVLLLKEGYDVTGMFAVNYDTDTRIYADDADNANANCWLPDYRDALRVAAKLGIKLIKLDFRKEYKKMVLDYMFREYKAGRTPNPDVMCNKSVKFGVWLDKAKELGFDKMATGHYAKIVEHGTLSIEQDGKKGAPCYVLHVPSDNAKDQTYFLHQLNQKQLARVLFPLGGYLKSEVRSLARKFGLPTAEKEESMGICFIGEVPMKEFLQTKIKNKKGDIVLSNGKKVGEHGGVAFYTIGERIGIMNYELRIKNEPLFVVNKKVNNNKLVVGYEDDPLLYKKDIKVGEVNWIAGHPPKFPLKCMVRLRHRQPLQIAKIERLSAQGGSATGGKDQKITAIFEKPQRAATPGQFAVFYLPRRSSIGAKAGKSECLGGGTIV